MNDMDELMVIIKRLDHKAIRKILIYAKVLLKGSRDTKEV